MKTIEKAEENKKEEEIVILKEKTSYELAVRLVGSEMCIKARK